MYSCQVSQMDELSVAWVAIASYYHLIWFIYSLLLQVRAISECF